MYGYVYLTTNEVNGKQYVGQHVAGEFDPSYKGSGTYLGMAIKKYGFENFTTSVLCWCETQDELNYREICEIFFNNTLTPNGYNIKLGGRQGGRLSVEGRRKLSEIHKGKPNVYRRTMCPLVAYTEYYILGNSIATINKKYGVGSAHEALKRLGLKRRRCGTRNGNTPWNKGKAGCFSEKTLKLMAENGRKQDLSHLHKKGRIPWNKGKSGIYSEETLKRMSEHRKGYAGPNKKFVCPLLISFKYYKEGKSYRQCSEELQICESLFFKKLKEYKLETKRK